MWRARIVGGQGEINGGYGVMIRGGETGENREGYFLLMDSLK